MAEYILREDIHAGLNEFYFTGIMSLRSTIDNLPAADAIEQLSEYADTIGRLKCEGWYLQQTKYHDGYHAIVTMPLPEPPKEK